MDDNVTWRWLGFGVMAVPPVRYGERESTHRAACTVIIMGENVSLLRFYTRIIFIHHIYLFPSWFGTRSSGDGNCRYFLYLFCVQKNKNKFIH